MKRKVVAAVAALVAAVGLSGCGAGTGQAARGTCLAALDAADAGFVSAALALDGAYDAYKGNLGPAVVKLDRATGQMESNDYDSLSAACRAALGKGD